MSGAISYYALTTDSTHIYFIKEMAQKRKLWSEQSMQEAVKGVTEGKGLREAARLYMCLLKLSGEGLMER